MKQFENTYWRDSHTSVDVVMKVGKLQENDLFEITALCFAKGCHIEIIREAWTISEIEELSESWKKIDKIAFIEIFEKIRDFANNLQI